MSEFCILCETEVDTSGMTAVLDNGWHKVVVDKFKGGRSHVIQARVPEVLTAATPIPIVRQAAPQEVPKGKTGRRRVL
jgi:hypothetical protein